MSSSPLGAPSAAPHGLLTFRLICRALQVLGVCSYFCFVLKSGSISSLISPCGSTLSLGLSPLVLRQTLNFSLLLSVALGVPFPFIFLMFSYQNATHPLKPDTNPSTKKSSFKLPIFVPGEGPCSPEWAQHRLWVQTDMSLDPGSMPLRKVIYLFNYQLFMCKIRTDDGL